MDDEDDDTPWTDTVHLDDAIRRLTADGYDVKGSNELDDGTYTIRAKRNGKTSRFHVARDSVVPMGRALKKRLVGRTKAREWER